MSWRRFLHSLRLAHPRLPLPDLSLALSCWTLLTLSHTLLHVLVAPLLFGFSSPSLSHHTSPTPSPPKSYSRVTYYGL